MGYCVQFCDMRKENRRLQEELKEKLSNTTWLDSERYFSADCINDTHAKPALLVYANGSWCVSCLKSFSLEYLQSHASSIPQSFRPTFQQFKVLPRWKRWEKRYGDLTEISLAAHKNLLRTKATYFHNRGLDDYIVKAMYGLLDGWGVIPVFNKDREVVDIVARSIKQKDAKYVISVLSENEIRPLYTVDWDLVHNSSKVYVTFGMFDVTAFDMLGLACVTGITGKSINATLFDEFPNKEFVIVPDKGEERAAYQLASKLGWRGTVLRLSYPYPLKDPDEFRRADTNKWRETINGLVSTITA